MPAKKKSIVEDEQELRQSTSPARPAAAAASDSAGELGTTARTRGPRPKYPPLSFLIFPLYRVLLTAVVAALLHHFVVNAYAAPILYKLLKGPTVTEWVKTSSAFTWLASLDSWPGRRLASRGQDVGDVLFFAAGISIVNLAVYGSITSVAYVVCTYTTWVDRYKIPFKESQLPSAQLLRKTVLEALVSFTIPGPLVLAIIFVVFGRFKHISSLDDLTSWDASFPVQVLHFAAANLSNEFFFYIAHRMLHEVPGLYAIHKQHHAFIATTGGGIAAENANPIEALTSNIFPTLSWCLIMAPFVPMTFVWSFLSVRLAETLEAHGELDLRGTLLYDLGVLHGTTFWHSYHHTKNCGNYGGPVADFMGGTMDALLLDKEIPRAPAIIDTPYDPYFKS